MTHVELAANRLGETLGTYATGYLDAACVLFQHARNGHGLVDLYFYPAAHSLRHGLELLAKHLSDHVAYLLNDKEYLYVRGHSLEEAWNRCRKEVRQIVEMDDTNGERADLLRHVDTIDHLVKKLHALDPSGMLFRYPEDVSNTNEKGKPKVRTARWDTHVPGDTVPLAPWISDASAAVDASQYLAGYFEEHVGMLMHLREQPPARIGDILLDQVPETHKKIWEAIRNRNRARSEPPED